MARQPKAFVLDTWSVIAYLDDEPAGQQVADLIADAHEKAIPVLMCIVNAGEVWYLLAREVSESDADSAIDELHKLGVKFVDVDWKLTRLAATIKSKHRMSYADCYAAALAKSEKADLVTGVGEFKQVEPEVKVQWL